MFRAIISTGRQADSLPWDSSHSPRFFTVSVVRTWSKDPETRRKQYDAVREKYKADSEFRTRIKLKNTLQRQARNRPLSKEQSARRSHVMSFRDHVTRRLKMGESLASETHVAEVSDSNKTVRQCVCCKRVVCGGPSRIWWRRKQDGEYECYPCFTDDWSKVFPIGYEDLGFLRNHKLSQKTSPEGQFSKPDPGSHSGSKSTS